MAFTALQATGPLGKSIRGTAELIARTAQFQTETGKDFDNSLADHCYWPHIPVASRTGSETQQFLTAPLCLVTTDPGQAFNRPWPASTNEIATGEVFVQLVLLADSGTYDDIRDQDTDLRNRIDTIISEALDLAGQRTAETQYLTVEQFNMSQPPEQNNLSEVQFVDTGDNPVRAWIFPLIAVWARR